MKIGILLTHPIQYFSPWFRELSNKFDLYVYYTCKQSPADQSKAGFGVEFEWDVPLLEGYKYFWLNNKSRNPSVSSFFGSDTPEIFEIIKKINFDAFIVFGWNYKSAWQAVWACKKNKIPVYMRGDSTLLTKKSILKSIIKYLPYRFLLPKFDGHLYVGELNKQYLKYYGVTEEKLFFIPHFVDNNFFRSKSELAIENGKRDELRRILSISNEAFVFLFVGKFIKKKTPHHFIQAFIKAKENSPTPISAVLVGDGPLKNNLVELSKIYKDDIHFAGFINQNDLPNYYAISDTLVLPSDGNETWGLVVNEAMASGLPCIVSDKVGCNPDLINNSETGFTYQYSYVDQLSEKMVKIIESLRLNSEKFTKNIEKKMNIYSLHTATKNLETVLRNVNGK